MNKIVFFMIIILIFLGCASTNPRGDPSVYIEKTLSDVINLKFNQSDGFLEKRYQSWPEELTFRFVSFAYIKVEENFVVLSDDSGNNISVYGEHDFFQIYRLRENGDFDPKKLYRVYYRIIPRESNFVKIAGIKNIDLEGIEGLITFNEFENIRNEERKRTSQIQEEERKKAQQAELEPRKIQARSAIQKAIASRNADIIMQSLTDSQSTFTTNRELLRGEAIIDDAYLAIARIASRNNNIQLEWLGAVLDNAGDRRLSSSEVIQVFNQNKVYYQDKLIIEQRIGDDYIIYTGYNDARRLIVLKNVKKVVNIGSNYTGRNYWTFDVFMKYTGVSTLKLISGNIDVPTFDVIYQYKD